MKRIKRTKPLRGWKVFSYDIGVDKKTRILTPWVVKNCSYRGPVVWNETPPEPIYDYRAILLLTLARPSNKAGFFAYKYEVAPRVLWEDRTLAHPSFFVFGDVSLFGVVYEHEWGYRAQGIRINKLVTTSTEFLDIEGLEETYRCPVMVCAKWSILDALTID